MWILESSSDLFQGRRMWLKPGKSYLFGRVKKDGVRFAIEHKTISRKHFIIKLDDVQPEDVGNIHMRTKVTIEDQNSKAGTNVNGELVKGSSKELKKEENYIKPGSLPQDLVLRWQPCVLTFNLLKKEIKSGMLKSKQERVRSLDIKAISEYVIDKTTHLVVNKRNTPKSLQALIDGRPLVAESYLDALEYAATPSDLNDEENLSPLEQDFDTAWPLPFDHLPPPGREPTLRPAEAYQPDSRRKTVFDSFIFVFIDQTQYDNLLPPITTGHGKALLYKITAHETTTEELVTFLRNAAGNKGFGNMQKANTKGGVILVRYKGNAGAEEWTNSLVNEASLLIDQRAIDQGEFLDSILANDALLLRQAIPYETNHDGITDTAPSSTPLSTLPQPSRSKPATENIVGTNRTDSPPVSTPLLNDDNQTVHQNGSLVQASETSQIEPTSREQSIVENDSQRSLGRSRFMLPKKSRVLDFDDEFDPNAVIPYQEDEGLPTAQTPDSQADMSPSQADGDMTNVKQEPPSSRKRPRSPTREASVTFDDEMDDLLPAAAAMKRRKLAMGNQNGTSSSTKTKTMPAPVKKVIQEKEIDVRKMAMAHRKAEEEKLKQEEGDDDDDEIQIAPGGVMPIYDVETILIDLPNRKKASHETTHEASGKWDPKWNGRKNFKAFRRAKDNASGEAGNDSRRNHTKIIVPMVDARTATYGMGEQYWDKTEEEKARDREKKRKASQRTTQSQSEQSRASQRQRSLTVDDSGSDDEHAGTNGSVPHASPELSRLQNEAEEIMDHAVDIDEPRRTRASDTQTQTQTTTTTSIRGAKRAANGVGRGGAAKKQKTLPVTVVHGSDSDDSDDMKFKFGSRRRGKGKA